MLLAMLAVTLAPAVEPVQVPPAPPRFERKAPLEGLPSVWIDARLAEHGVAQQAARANQAQARILWIEGSANLDRLNSDEKIEQLVARIADTGFNTVVLDVKAIVGRTLYPSDLAPQLTSWREGRMAEGYDPLRKMAEEAKKHGLDLFVSMNAFSEGHSWALRDRDLPDTAFGAPGWGYEHPELQTVQYESVPVVHPVGAPERAVAIHPRLDPAEWSEPLAAFSAMRSLGEGETGVVVDRNGIVQDEATAIPSNGSFVVARGEARSLLQSRRLVFATQPLLRPISANQTQIPLMMNPHLDANQTRALSFVREVMERYEVDGFLYDDRLRFGGINADFSEEARSQFAAYVGEAVRWPEDVYEVTLNPNLAQGRRPGKHYDAWLAWRALTMRNFVRRVGATVREARPGAKFGIYAGSWYGDYPKFGSNYASDEVEAGFPFLTDAYRATGFASDLDLLVVGAYYRVPTLHEALRRGVPMGPTVEAAGVLCNRLAGDQTWVYAGIILRDFWGDDRGLGEALQAAAVTTQGIMVFDLSHEMDRYWDFFKRAFARKRVPPHRVPGLLEAVRSRREQLEDLGLRPPPVPFFEGVPGTGF